MQENFSQTGCAFPIFSLALAVQLCCVWYPQSTCLSDQANSLHLGLAQCPPPREHFHLSKKYLSSIHNAEEASKPSFECHWSGRHPLGQTE